MAQGRSKMFWILLGAAAAVVLTIIVLNLSAGETRKPLEISHEYGVADPQFPRYMGSFLGPAILEGNTVTTLRNGDEIFPAMLAAIRSATRSVTFETYIYWSGEIGREFAGALAERARAGVRVHVLLDWAGAAKMDDQSLSMMRDAGVEVEKYHPLRWYNLSRMNNRTHRKLLVVDGKVGFTGGVGVADVWAGHAQDSAHWRDTHFRLEGPAVNQMQAAFIDNWIKTRAQALHGDDYFPPLDSAGPARAQVFKSSAGDGSENTQLMYLASIAAAERSILLSSSYFVPDSLSIAKLAEASRRGVRVEIIVPGRHIDSKIVRKASRGLWGPLLEAGVRIFEYQPTMFHVKVMVVDGLWSSVGSTNFDERSFRLNDEANLNVLDGDFARVQEGVFEEDKAQSREVTLEMWRNRPRSERIKEWLAGLFRSQL